MPTWIVGDVGAGIRLDKFLAALDRVGSRAKAAAALDRGKVFVNDIEVALADAGRRMAVGDAVRVWTDRPGSAKRRSTLGDTRDLPIVYEDEALIVLNKPPGVLSVPLPLHRREGERSVFADRHQSPRSLGPR